ncbi:hypothetical protein [Microbacterium sp. 77mftsu3.1]|uniref:hypothetical protein n=1 Tax=Microbacterium sp. 77mftsu3.1 TaxID=1761802 RepID=UPI000375C4C8|nr:hypothetical protein [Microbacterium sp. 77mftsu3.1]SDH41903.1 hypothetical protein SAMN04488590_3292 [Microbacterium sp. 77mftsu3.1]
MTTIAAETDLTAELRIPGDLFRAVNPRTFSFPDVHAERHETEFGVIYAITAKVEGIPETFDLLYNIHVSEQEVEDLVAEFNADTYASWNALLFQFFAEQRTANAEKRALLDADEAFLLELQAGFLR